MGRWITGIISVVICFSGVLEAQEIRDSQEIAREKMLGFFSGEWISRGLYVATKMKVADHLESGQKTVEELANLTGSNKDSLQRLLHMLAGFDIFEETAPGVFANTEMSSLLLTSNPESLHELCVFFGEDIHHSWGELLSSVQTGTPAFELKFKQPVFTYFRTHPDSAALFQKAMKEKSEMVIKSTLKAYDFSAAQTVYDIGGGYGHFMKALLSKYPHLSGVVFELPEVVEKLKEQSPEFESSRCQLNSGDFFVSIPKGGDVYFLKSILHDWDDKKAEKILKNCHKAMHSNSRLLILEIVLQPKGQSVHANCMDLLMMAITGGKERTLENFTQMLSHSGFAIQKIYPTGTEFSIIEVKKAK